LNLIEAIIAENERWHRDASRHDAPWDIGCAVGPALLGHCVVCSEKSLF
jgi:hypothetical protein